MENEYPLVEPKDSGLSCGICYVLRIFTSKVPIHHSTCEFTSLSRFWGTEHKLTQTCSRLNPLPANAKKFELPPLARARVVVLSGQVCLSFGLR